MPCKPHIPQLWSFSRRTSNHRRPSHTFICRPNAIAKLDIDNKDKTPHSHTTATINGIAPPKQCLKIKGLVIKPLSEDTPIKLDSALTQKLPNAIQEIPTNEEVSSIPGLSHLSRKFPTKKNWPTILLIGRDCMKAQQQSNLTWSEDESQLAVKTPLGWAIMGKPAQSTRPLQKGTSKGLTPRSPGTSAELFLPREQGRI